MDLKYHVALSAILAGLYLTILGGAPAGAALILAVGVGMDIDHIASYLYYTRDFRPGLLKNTYAYYRRAMDWLFFRRGEPYENMDFVVFHNFEVALFAFFLLADSPLFLPAAIGYLGHMSLDLASWGHLVFKVGTRTPGQAVSFFSLAGRLLSLRDRK